MNGSNYTNPDNLIINTIEGVLYLGMKNDVSFIINNELNIYSKSLIQLPTPKYVVFYNGTEEDGDFRVLKLSDSFTKADGQEACLECTATMININYGHNQKLMESCRELYEYSFLIEEIRKGVRGNLDLAEAVDRAVEVCIREFDRNPALQDK